MRIVKRGNHRPIECETASPPGFHIADLQARDNGDLRVEFVSGAFSLSVIALPKDSDRRHVRIAERWISLCGLHLVA